MDRARQDGPADGDATDRPSATGLAATDIDDGRFAELQAAGALATHDLGELVRMSEVVFATIPDDAALRPLVLVEGGLAAHLRPDRISSR